MLTTAIRQLTQAISPDLQVGKSSSNRFLLNMDRRGQNDDLIAGENHRIPQLNIEI
jgi:hypothetical protein